MTGASRARHRYDGPAIVAVDGTSVPVEAHLRRETGGTWGGRVWTDDPAVDMNHVAAATTLLLRVDQRAASFTVDRVLDQHAHITGIGIAPF
ncbi:DUF4873 domain-containing protein [Embleya sp. NPDC050493]|uniref:DUF4873 domain-containing protein n=1 Tax=Embleya sp. NPDC050493 TaxID=3363989 RepID=UPI0037B5628D